jgi:hypothetical protein
MQKPGGMAVSPATILAAVKRASARAADLHTELVSSLQALEDKVAAERVQRLNLLRKLAEAKTNSAGKDDVYIGMKFS